MQVENIPGPKREPGIADHFSVFRDVAAEDTNSTTHGVKQCQRQALHVRRKGKQSGIREDLLQRRSREPVQKLDSLARVLAQLSNVFIGVAGTTRQNQLHGCVDRLEGFDEEIQILLGRKAAEKQHIIVGLQAKSD